MTATQVIGVDPGVTTGVFSFEVIDRSIGNQIALQLRGQVYVIDDLLRMLKVGFPLIVALESFVPSPRSTKVGNARDVKHTKDTITHVQAMGFSVVFKPAVTVKGWATDKRLEAAGLLDATHQMRHARDAARHALYAAVNSGLIADPLSRKGKAS